MGDFYSELNELVRDIMGYKVNRENTQMRINELKAKYGENNFPPFDFQKEPEPWNEEYLRKLKTMNITGACSEKFILHMAEVSEKIAEKKKRAFWGKVIAIAAVAVAAVVIFIILI